MSFTNAPIDRPKVVKTLAGSSLFDYFFVFNALPKTMKRLVLYGLLLLGTACANPRGSAVKAPKAAPSAPASEQDGGARTAVAFLKWYRDHLSELNRITLVNQGGSGGDTTQVYSVNRAGTEAYLAALGRSGYVSPRYLDAWRQYFRQCDQSFRADLQREGPPRGFDYDFVFQSQDYATELTQLEQLTVTPLPATPGRATLLVAFPTGHQLKFELAGAGNGWFIDRIRARPGVTLPHSFPAAGNRENTQHPPSRPEATGRH
jgi:hypothetical protein